MNNNRCRIPVTLTLKRHAALFPLMSTASHVTRVCPMVNSVPDSGLQVILTMSAELSVVVGVCHSITAVGLPISVPTSMSATHVIFGASLSFVTAVVTVVEI